MASEAGSRQCGPEGGGRSGEEEEVEVEEVEDEFDLSLSRRPDSSSSVLPIAIRSSAGVDIDAFSLAEVRFLAEGT